jgi:hypothetical protein
MDIHTAEPLVPEPSIVKVEIAIGKLKKYKSSGTAQIQAELFKAGSETLCSEMQLLIRSICNKDKSSDSSVGIALGIRAERSGF